SRPQSISPVAFRPPVTRGLACTAPFARHRSTPLRRQAELPVRGVCESLSQISPVVKENVRGSRTRHPRQEWSQGPTSSWYVSPYPSPPREERCGGWSPAA